MRNFILIMSLAISFSISCTQKNENEFNYDEFKQALYYNEHQGTFSDLGNLEMCVNRWGTPKYIKTIGTSNRNGFNAKSNTIVFKWENIKVENKSVEIYFKMDDSGKTIEDVFSVRGTISLNNSKHAIVKEFRLTK